MGFNVFSSYKADRILFTLCSLALEYAPAVVFRDRGIFWVDVRIYCIVSH